jgi:hypothetical protein
MLVSFRWMQTAQRGPRVSQKLAISRSLLTTLTLATATALAGAAAAGLGGSAATAAPFDDTTDPSGTASVLLHEPGESLLAANPVENPAADSPPLAADSAPLAADAAQDSDAGAALAEPMWAVTCTAGASEPCGCSACRGETLLSSGPSAGLLSTVGGACADRLCEPRGPLADYDPRGLIQRLAHRHKTSGACWTGRADLLLLWRNAPPSQALITDNVAGITALDANDVDSALAAGPRFSLFRTDACGNAWEATYLRAFNFRGQRTLPATVQGYDIALPGIFGDQETLIDGASINLGSGIQSFELNRYHKVCHNIRLLGGFRWVEWRESATLTTNLSTGDTDIYQSSIYNSLYGGQIGFDANVLTTKWLRVESVMKGGAYGNNVAANSLLVKPNAGIDQPFGLAQSPASCAFVGELGFTGVIPITCCLDFRFGYFGMWLEGLAQPTRQFLTQDLVSVPPTGTLDTKGGTVVQGVSLGLEGRW